MSRLIHAAPIAIACVTAAAGGPIPVESPFLEDFESYTVGQPAPSPWIDIATRVEGTTIPAPTILVTQTTAPDGSPTRAYQNIDAVGDNSGAYATIQESRLHRVSVDVRVDQFTNNPGPHFGWPAGVGFTHDNGQPDIDADPQALVYAWRDRRWYLFLGGEGMPRANLLIPTPLITTGQWLRISVQLDTLTGRTDAWIDDATGARLGSRTFMPTTWDTQVGEFDGILIFDGEGGAHTDGFPLGDIGGVSTYDNLRYDRLPDCPADPAPPFGVSDFSDVLAFLGAFGAGDPAADIAAPLGVHDFTDVSAFLVMFTNGCP